MRRVYLLGAGFSKPAGMPLANEVMPADFDELPLHDKFVDWLKVLRKRLSWQRGGNYSPLNIEEVFHLTTAETYRLRLSAQTDTSSGSMHAKDRLEDLEQGLPELEKVLYSRIHKSQRDAKLDVIERWAKHVTAEDSVITANYDTLAEQALR
jgi:hypothetical protein